MGIKCGLFREWIRKNGLNKPFFILGKLGV